MAAASGSPDVPFAGLTFYTRDDGCATIVASLGGRTLTSAPGVGTRFNALAYDQDAAVRMSDELAMRHGSTRPVLTTQWVNEVMDGGRLVAPSEEAAYIPIGYVGPLLINDGGVVLFRVGPPPAVTSPLRTAAAAPSSSSALRGSAATARSAVTSPPHAAAPVLRSAASPAPPAAATAATAAARRSSRARSPAPPPAPAAPAAAATRKSTARSAAAAGSASMASASTASAGLLSPTGEGPIRRGQKVAYTPVELETMLRWLLDRAAPFGRLSPSAVAIWESAVDEGYFPYRTPMSLYSQFRRLQCPVRAVFFAYAGMQKRPPPALAQLPPADALASGALPAGYASPEFMGVPANDGRHADAVAGATAQAVVVPPAYYRSGLNTSFTGSVSSPPSAATAATAAAAAAASVGSSARGGGGGGGGSSSGQLRHHDADARLLPRGVARVSVVDCSDEGMDSDGDGGSSSRHAAPPARRRAAPAPSRAPVTLPTSSVLRRGPPPPPPPPATAPPPPLPKAAAAVPPSPARAPSAALARMRSPPSLRETTYEPLLPASSVAANTPLTGTKRGRAGSAGASPAAPAAARPAAVATTDGAPRATRMRMAETQLPSGYSGDSDGDEDEEEEEDDDEGSRAASSITAGVATRGTPAGVRSARAEAPTSSSSQRSKRLTPAAPPPPPPPPASVARTPATAIKAAAPGSLSTLSPAALLMRFAAARAPAPAPVAVAGEGEHTLGQREDLNASGLSAIAYLQSPSVSSRLLSRTSSLAGGATGSSRSGSNRSGRGVADSEASGGGSGDTPRGHALLHMASPSTSRLSAAATAAASASKAGRDGGSGRGGGGGGGGRPAAATWVLPVAHPEIPVPPCLRHGEAPDQVAPRLIQLARRHGVPPTTVRDVASTVVVSRFVNFDTVDRFLPLRAAIAAHSNKLATLLADAIASEGGVRARTHRSAAVSLENDVYASFMSYLADHPPSPPS